MSVTGVATLVLSFLLYRCTKFMFPRITLHESLTILAPYTHARSKIILEILKAFLELQLGKVREMFLANGLISDCEIVPEGALELLDVGSSHSCAWSKQWAWLPIWSLREEKELFPIPIWRDVGPQVNG